jgi:peroxiredoxin
LSPIVLVNWLINLGIAAAIFGGAIFCLVYLVWAFLGERGATRSLRLRKALASALMSVAGVLAAVAFTYLYTLPMSMSIIRPDYHAPYQALSRAAAVAVPMLILLSAVLAGRAAFVEPGARRRKLQFSRFSLFLAAAIGVLDYWLIYSIQMPAYSRFVMIESRDWMTRVGEPAPDMSVVKLDGQQFSLSELRGKVVLVNFFATWCGPCMVELPHMEKLWNQWRGNDGFEMLVIDRGESQETAEAFRAKSGFTFPIAVDPKAIAFNKFAKEGIPRTYLISKEGTILYQSIGFADNDVYHRELATLEQTIQSALEERPER